jgi:hypothetical protein
VHTVGMTVGLVMAGSWTGPGNEVGEQQPRPGDEAVHGFERLADGLRGLVRGTLERAPRRLGAPCNSRLRVAREGDDGDWLDLATAPIQTPTVTSVGPQPGSGEMTRRSGVVASLGTVVSHEVGHS